MAKTGVIIVGMGAELKARFSELQEEYPNHSSYIIFVRLMREQGVTSKNTIHLYFNRLVDKRDYAPNEKRGVLNAVFKMLQHKGILAAKTAKITQVQRKSHLLSPVRLFA